MRYGLDVVGIDTETLTAEVVEYQAVGDGAVRRLEDDAVHNAQPAVIVASVAISASVGAPRPKPTAVRIDNDPVQDSRDRWFWIPPSHLGPFAHEPLMRHRSRQTCLQLLHLRLRPPLRSL